MRKSIISVFIVGILLASVLGIGYVAAEPVEKIPVIVGFKGRPDAALVRSHGGDIKYVYHIIQAIACSLPQEAIDALEKNPVIAYIEADFEVYAIDAELDNSWGVKHIGAGVVHGYNKGTGVKVAIIDTGIDYTHPDLDANYKGGIDYVNDDTDPKDDHGHGTHVAGIVAAEDNDIGVVGVAPEADLYAVKILDSSGSGSYSDLIAGIQWCVDNGMEIISMSLGGTSDSTAVHNACDIAYNNGSLLVAAAGNHNRWQSSDVVYPAKYDSVIAVSATDKDDSVPRWSNYGPEVELAAPGVDVKSTWLDGTYEVHSGTSMSTPHVSGTAALVMVAYLSWNNTQVREQLQNTADDLPPEGKDDKTGYGLVDADEAAPGVDTTPPVISAVASSDITTSSATITWTTDEPSDSVVNYGISKDLGSTASDATMVTSHSISLTGLAAERKYYYEVRSTDSAGNTAVDNNGSLCYTFTTLAPDMTPPSTITDLNATAGAYPDILLAWTAATDDVGVDHYNIYRSTTETIDRATDLLATASGTVTSYTDSTGTAETTYHYAICAVDAADNEADLSNIANATVAAAPSNTMHVKSIDMSTETIGRGPYSWTRAVATVTIVDATDNPVEGATVSGHWSRLANGDVSGETNANGQVTLKSKYVKNASGIFTFTVDDVVKEGWTYDSSANVETSDSITV